MPLDPICVHLFSDGFGSPHCSCLPILTTLPWIFQSTADYLSTAPFDIPIVHALGAEMGSAGSVLFLSLLYGYFHHTLKFSAVVALIE